MTEQAAINQYFEAEFVPSAVMDRVWAEGWRHFGTSFFRYEKTQGSSGDWQHVLPLRVKLEQFRFSDSQKRVTRRNAHLECLIRDAFIDDEKNALFELHKLRFTENIPESLETFLHPQPARIPCITKEICLYQDGRLIGAHFLDLGETATSSVCSIYDPNESKHSLGIYLIVCSIKFSCEHGMTHYYPGYAYREPSTYDYKKKLGSLEVFDWRGNWLEFLPDSQTGS